MADPTLPRPVDRALDPGFRHGQSTEPNYSGVTSFLRRRYARDGGGAEVVVWGVPLDVAVSNRPGTRFGPRAIRAASTILDGDPFYPFGFDPFETLDAPRTYGIEIVHGNVAGEMGPAALARHICERVGDAPVYLSFDIDALDPAFAPGTGTPVCGGLSTREVIACLRRLGALDLKGFDVVEVSPPYDHAEITALAGATLASLYLCLLAERKEGGRSPAL